MQKSIQGMALRLCFWPRKDLSGFMDMMSVKTKPILNTKHIFSAIYILLEYFVLTFLSTINLEI